MHIKSIKFKSYFYVLIRLVVLINLLWIGSILNIYAQDIEIVDPAILKKIMEKEQKQPQADAFNTNITDNNNFVTKPKDKKKDTQQGFTILAKPDSFPKSAIDSKFDELNKRDNSFEIQGVMKDYKHPMQR